MVRGEVFHEAFPEDRQVSNALSVEGRRVGPCLTHR